MSARGKARRRAVEVLFETDLRGSTVDTGLESLDSRTEHPANPYTVQIVQGVEEHRALIDETLATYARGWTLDRMPGVDRAILRVATWELLYGDVPPPAVLSEAVGLADELSTEESGRYINGVLARISSVRDRITAP